MKIWWNFQFNYSDKLKVLCMKSPKKFHKILVHKIHQAPTEFFLRHCESKRLCLLNSPETGKKVCLEKDSPTKAERKKLFEIYLTDICKIFILLNSLSLSKFYKHRYNNFQIGVCGFKTRNFSLKVTKHLLA